MRMKPYILLYLSILSHVSLANDYNIVEFDTFDGPGKATLKNIYEFNNRETAIDAINQTNLDIFIIKRLIEIISLRNRGISADQERLDAEFQSLYSQVSFATVTDCIRYNNPNSCAGVIASYKKIANINQKQALTRYTTFFDYKEMP